MQGRTGQQACSCLAVDVAVVVSDLVYVAIVVVGDAALITARALVG